MPTLCLDAFDGIFLYRRLLGHGVHRIPKTADDNGLVTVALVKGHHHFVPHLGEEVHPIALPCIGLCHTHPVGLVLPLFAEDHLYLHHPLVLFLPVFHHFSCGDAEHILGGGGGGGGGQCVI